MLKKLITNCISCKVLLKEKNMVKNRKKGNKCPNNITNENKKPSAKHVYENNIMTKTKRTPKLGRSGCRKTFLMLSLLKVKNPDDV